jgi:hypothetical protein
MTRRLLTVGLAVALACTVSLHFALAQDAAPASDAPAGGLTAAEKQAFFDRLPADALLCFVTWNPGQAAGSQEGIRKALMAKVPMMAEMGGGETPDLIDEMASGVVAADAIDRSRPFAGIMLDPLKLRPELTDGDDVAELDDSNNSTLMYVPTTDADALLAGYEKDEDTGLWVGFDDMDGTWYAQAIEGYVLLGEDSKAIQAAAKASGAWKNVPARHQGLLLKQDIAIFMDVDTLLAVAEKDPAEGDGKQIVTMLTAGFGKDADTLVGGVTMSETAGYALDVRVVPKADSAMAKMLASPLKGKALDLQRLPKVPVVAMYSFSQPEVQAGESPMKAIMELARTDTPDGESMGGDPDANMLLNFLSTFTDNAQSGAIVFGMGPGSVMTFNGLLETENSAETLKAIEKATVQLAKDAKASENPEFSESTFEYKAEAETISDQAIHHIIIDSPDMQEDAEQTQRLLGDEKLVIRLAAPDLKTVVLTLGGKDAMMKEALAAAAKGKSGFLAEEATQQVLKGVPNKAYGTVLVQPSTVADLIAGIFQVNPADMGMAMKFKKVPLAVGWGPQGQDMQIAGVAPIDSLVDGAQAFQMFFMGMMRVSVGAEVPMENGQNPPPPPPAEDIPPANDF